MFKLLALLLYISQNFEVLPYRISGKHTFLNFMIEYEIIRKKYYIINYGGKQHTKLYVHDNENMGKNIYVIIIFRKLP